MDEKSKAKPDLENHPLVGRWYDGDEWPTSVVLTVNAQGDGFTVEAVDNYDEEAGEVYGCRWDGEALSFAVHFASTGRLVKYKLRALSENRIDLIYTYTHQELWHRIDDAKPERQ